MYFNWSFKRTERPNRTDRTEGRRDYLAIVGVVVTLLTLLRLVFLLNISPSTACVDVACGGRPAAVSVAPRLAYSCVRYNHWQRDVTADNRLVYIILQSCWCFINHFSHDIYNEYNTREHTSWIKNIFSRMSEHCLHEFFYCFLNTSRHSLDWVSHKPNPLCFKLYRKYVYNIYDSYITVAWTMHNITGKSQRGF